MKVLVIGGTGYIGARLVSVLQGRGDLEPMCASRRASGSGLRLDTRDTAALTQALRGAHAVVHCVAGSASAISQGARALAVAVRASGVRSVVYLSSMAVYGDRQGPVDERSPWGRPRGWYARAKQDAERAMADLARDRALAARGLRVTVLRPGCVWGPGSTLWVARIARWLAQGRLGDLGDLGDGWTHGVAVDDVALAIVRVLQMHAADETDGGTDGPLRTFNLAAPDSPRWNDWFTDLALALGHVPLRRVRPWQLRADAWLLGPPLHAVRTLLTRAGGTGPLPEAISPGLLRLWQGTLRMDVSTATRALGLGWTPYPESLRACVGALRAGPVSAAGADRAAPGAARAR